MKMLVHRTRHGLGDLFSLRELKDHLRVSDDSEDAAIALIGETAAAEIEQFAQVALVTQTVRVTIFNPSCESGLSLPIGPVADGAVPTVTVDGEAFASFDFVGGLRPYIYWVSEFAKLAPRRLTIEYIAGFGDSFNHVPADLSQALMDQAALHYDGRSPMDAKTLTTSPHMARVSARYRGVQL